MLLVVCEAPAMKLFEIPIYVHAVLELFALAIIGIELFLKYKWMRTKHFFSHIRTSIKFAVLVVMIFEALGLFLEIQLQTRAANMTNMTS